MLRNKDLLKVRDLVYTATMDNGVCLAKPGTPLSILNSVVQQMVVAKDDSDGSMTSLTSRESNLITMSRAANNEGTETHGRELTSISQHTAKLVANTLNYARNTVNPIVLSIIEAAEQAKISIVSEKTLDKTIVSTGIADPYNDPMLESLISRHGRLVDNVKPISFKLSEILFADMTVDHFKTTISTGNMVLDTATTALFDSLSAESRKSLLKGYAIVDKVDTAVGTNLYTDHQALFAYLFLLGVNAGRLGLIDTEGLDSSDRLAVSEALEYYGFHLNQRLKAFEIDIANDIMIVGSQWDSIYVLEPTYSQWLESNGSREALLAFMSTFTDKRPNARSQVALKSQPEKYATLYDRITRNISAEKRVKVNAKIDDLIVKAVHDFGMDAYPDDVKMRHEVKNKAIAMVKETPYNHSFDIDAHALRIVCAAICNDKNDAYIVLSDMRGYLMDNPESTPGTAALVAATRLIGRWVASQMYITYN